MTHPGWWSYFWCGSAHTLQSWRTQLGAVFGARMSRSSQTLAFDGRSLVRPRRVEMKIRRWVWRKLIIQPLLSVVRCLVLQENRVEGAAPSCWRREQKSQGCYELLAARSEVTRSFCSALLQVSPLSSHQPTECSNSQSKIELGVSRVKSFLPVPRSKVTQCSQNTKRSSSSSNTRQIEINNNSKEEIWNFHKKRTSRKTKQIGLPTTVSLLTSVYLTQKPRTRCKYL